MLRVGLSGGLASVLDVVALLLLVEKGQMPVGIAAFLAASLGAAASFVVNKTWAFRDPSPLQAGQVVKFAGVALGTALGTGACVSVLSVGMGLPYLAAKGISAVALFLCWTYPIQSRFVFRHRICKG